MQAGAIALRVYEKNPNHPGAAHYAIHAFDDPEHAIIALPAARRYAAIAPEAFHARHMPAHIFLQLGMWPEAAASNESAWAVSVAWSGRKGLPLSARDYHSNHWLLYVYLQQGRYGKAEEVLAIKHQDMAAAGNDRAVRRSYFEMLGIFGFETGQWELASKLSAENEVKVVAPAAADGGTHGGHGGAAASASPTPKAAAPVQGPRYRSDVFPPAFIRGVAAAMAGNAAEVEKVLAQLRATREQLKGEDQAYGARLTEIRELMLSAIAGTAKGEYESAIESMKRATGLEEQMSPPSGPPETIKPTHELFGEILLKAGKPQEAAKQFATALLRQPNRSRSLLGAARAAAQMGDKATAMRMYSDLLRVWQQADAQLPELREARDYVAQNKSSVAIAGR
jgi:tetratricopeptide (TPR) repeat protein